MENKGNELAHSTRPIIMIGKKWKSVYAGPAMIAVAAMTACDASPVAGPIDTVGVEGSPLKPANSPFLDGFFVIGVFSQPADSFAKWKARGINTVLEVPMRHDPAAWDAAARESGLRIIRRPLADPRADIGRKDLLAWSHWDEPDAAGRIFEWTPGFERTYAEWRRIDPTRKIFLNFAGPDITWFTTRSDDYSRRYASYYPRLIATTDWVAADLYPNGGWLNQAHQSRRGDVTLLAEPIRALRRLTDKPQFAFIEASEIEYGNVPGARAPSAASVRAQVWYAVVHGVRGIFYFPAVVGTRGFRFDGTSPEIADEITRQNALLAKVGPVLQGAVNSSGHAVTVPAPLEAGWRRGKDEFLAIVVNPTPNVVPSAPVRLEGVADGSILELVSGKARTLKSGTLTEDFEPYAVRLYLARVRA